MSLEKIIDMAMSKDPDGRYQQVEEMLVDLRSIEDERKSGIQNRKTVAHVSEKAKRKKWFAAAAGMLTVIIAVTLALILKPDSAIDSVAIIPFYNGSGNPEIDYLSDGITESDYQAVKAFRFESHVSAFGFSV